MITGLASHCESCGIRLYIEKEIEDATGGTMDICLECINKVTSVIIKKWRDKVNDARVRQELRERLDVDVEN